MAHSRTSGAPRAVAAASGERLGLQRPEAVAAAGGFQRVEHRQPRGEIEGLAVEILAAVLRRRRAGEEKPLRVGAAELAQLLELLPALDALGHHMDVKVLRHGDDGADDREVREVRHQVAYEAAVDLERIHAPALEVREARVADAEVIDGDAHPELAQRRHRVLARISTGRLAPLEHRALGELTCSIEGSTPC